MKGFLGFREGKRGSGQATDGGAASLGSDREKYLRSELLDLRAGLQLHFQEDIYRASGT